MKKRLFPLILILLLTTSTFCQTNDIQSLVEEAKNTRLDMWDLTELAIQRLDSKEKLSKFFYLWIGSNINYDYEIYESIKEGKITNEEFINSQDEYTVYESRKGVCSGYSKLYQWFMREIDVEVVIISGHIRDERNHYVNIQEDDHFRHGWNAIKLDDRWMLVDATWGTSNDPSQSEFYYDISPEWLIITHYPEEMKWQLLEKPLTLDEFNKSKFIKPIWFFVGFSDIPKLFTDEKYYYYAFKQPDSEWTVNLQYSADNINFENIQGIDSITQDGITYYRFEKQKITKEVFFKVNLLKRIKEENGYSTKRYEDVINFKI